MNLLKVCVLCLCCVPTRILCYESDVFDGYHYQRAFPQDVMVDVINNFGLALLEAHSEGNENNIALSPYGATSVLVALGEGLRGYAIQEIQDAIRIPTDASVVRVGLRDVHRHLKSYFIPKEGFLAGLTLSSDQVSLLPEYENILRFYGYDLESFNNPLYPDTFYTMSTPTANETTVLDTTTETSDASATTIETTETTTSSKSDRGTTVLEPEEVSKIGSGITTEDLDITTDVVTTQNTMTVSTQLPTTESNKVYTVRKSEDHTTEGTAFTARASKGIATVLPTQTINETTTYTGDESAMMTDAERHGSTETKAERTTTEGVKTTTELFEINRSTVKDRFGEEGGAVEDKITITTESTEADASTAGDRTTMGHTKASTQTGTTEQEATVSTLQLPTFSVNTAEEMSTLRSTPLTGRQTTLTQAVFSTNPSTSTTQIPSTITTDSSTTFSNNDTAGKSETTEDESTSTELKTDEAIVAQPVGTNGKQETGNSPDAMAVESTDNKVVVAALAKVNENETTFDTPLATVTSTSTSSYGGSTTMRRPGSTVLPYSTNVIATSVTKTITTSTSRYKMRATNNFFSPFTPGEEITTFRSTKSSSAIARPSTKSPQILVTFVPKISSSTTMQESDYDYLSTEGVDMFSTDRSEGYDLVDANSTSNSQEILASNLFSNSKSDNERSTENVSTSSVSSTSTYDYHSSESDSGLSVEEEEISLFSDEDVDSSEVSDVGTTTAKFKESSSSTPTQSSRDTEYAGGTETYEDSSSSSELPQKIINVDGTTEDDYSVDSVGDFDSTSTDLPEPLRTSRGGTANRSLQKEKGDNDERYELSTTSPQRLWKLKVATSTTENRYSQHLEENVVNATTNSVNRVAIKDGSASVMANVTRRKTRKTRSVIDYIIARYHDMYHVNNNKKRRHYQPEETSSFLTYGKYREPNINFMTYDAVLPFAFLPTLNAMTLSFPLDSTQYYLLLILPVDDDGIDRLVLDLKKTVSLREVIGSLKYTHVNAVIPSFMLKGYVILTSTLQKLGIRKIFEPRHADFSAMTKEPDLYVTNVEQAITVTIRNYVDPENLPSHRSLQQFRPVEFKADHPFLYFVMDSDIHVALMAGKIVNPLNSRIR